MPRAPHRLRLSRKKGFRLAPGAVRVARPGKWGNPFRVGDPGTPDPMTAVRQFRAFMDDCLSATHPSVAATRAALRELAGKNLACWCPLHQPCHADVLLELANRISDDAERPA